MESLNDARYPPLTAARLSKAKFFLQHHLCGCSGVCVWAVIASILAIGLLVGLIVVLIQVKVFTACTMALLNS